MPAREISQAVITRLPRYYRVLGELRDQGQDRISSRELSDIMKVTASQIRQDFNNFGDFGQQGYGYNVVYLHDEIGKILGVERLHRMILVGFGNLGHALARYARFTRSGFLFDCAFDANPAKTQKLGESIPILDISELEAYIASHEVDIAVLTVPKEAAGEMARRLYKAGIRAIWNFSPVDLEVPGDVTVENVHLQDSLLKLSYNAEHHE